MFVFSCRSQGLVKRLSGAVILLIMDLVHLIIKSSALLQLSNSSYPPTQVTHFAV
jgi:hypothetical protein